MRLLTFLLAGSAAILFPFAALTQSAGEVKIKEVPIKPTPVVDGAAMYAEYCAVCHGKTGKGDGPAAPALKTVPGNLTMLAQRNNGIYPKMRVMSMIEGKIGITAHGTREMPMWGQLFRSMERGIGSGAIMRVRNLTTYVESLQVK